MSATLTARTTSTARPRQRGHSRPPNPGVVPCGWCRGTGRAPIDIAGTIRAQARGLDPIPSDMPCPACVNAAGRATGSVRPGQAPFVPDYVPATWLAGLETPLPDEPGLPQVSPRPWVRVIVSQIEEIQARRAAG